MGASILSIQEYAWRVPLVSISMGKNLIYTTRYIYLTVHEVSFYTNPYRQGINLTTGLGRFVQETTLSRRPKSEIHHFLVGNLF